MSTQTTSPATGCNTVVIEGRVAAPAEERDLPSGDAVVTLRVVVERPATRRGEGGRRQVDVIEVACWTRRTQRSAVAFAAQDLVHVEGALRRRFFRTPGGAASRYEVEAARLTRWRPVTA